MLKDNPVMVYREVVWPKTYLLLRGDTVDQVKIEASRLLNTLKGHDPYGGTYVEKESDKFVTRIDYWTEKENG
jgi:hypothetical protein